MTSTLTVEIIIGGQVIMQSFMNWHSVLVVGLGGFLGASFRYLISLALHESNKQFPYSTLIVNILGSFLLSLILYFSEETALINESYRNFLTIGLLGAFTTLSAFSLETFNFLEQKEYFYLALYLGLTIVLSVSAIFAGKYLAQSFGRMVNSYLLQ
ncbi:MAG: fluoride efflux transporter CrcB [Candidatus Heimdallarchaeota archaeon]|nr:fluoride efflux transporter CrcB [Candidatus Heimdallarchaeota archaeon]